MSNIAHIGDVILATAALPVLKKAFPSAEIGFLTNSKSHVVVDDHIYVDHVHFFDHPHFIRSNQTRKQKKKIGSASFLKAINEVRGMNYDLAIDLYSIRPQNAGYLLKSVGIPERVGFWGQSHQHFTHKSICYLERDHVVEDFAVLLSSFGLGEFLPHFKPTLLYKSPIKKKELPENYILIHVGVGERYREWTIESWKELVESVRKMHSPLVFLGFGERESALVSQLIQPGDFNLCNQCSWKEVIPVIEGSRLMIGLDSMAGHVAAAVFAKAVIIYGGVSPAFRWRPYSPSCHVVLPPEEYCPQGKPLRGSIQYITPKVVLDKIEEIIS